MSLDNSINFLNNFGSNLKRIRKGKKLSLRKLASNCNIDHSDIAKMEKGEVNITLLTLEELAKGLNILPIKLIEVKKVTKST